MSYSKYSSDYMVVIYKHINYFNRIHQLKEVREELVLDKPDVIVSKLI